MPVIHVRLKEGRDDDLIAWYGAQSDKSRAVRAAIRTAMRLQDGATQETSVEELVVAELARLPDVVAAAVGEALRSHSLASTVLARSGEEDPELAARFDEQLTHFFEDT
jgi:hypothetical protein